MTWEHKVQILLALAIVAVAVFSAWQMWGPA